MRRTSFLTAFVCLVTVFVITIGGSARAFTDQSVIRGFNKVMFGSKFSSEKHKTRYLRKFMITVRFYIHHTASINRKPEAVRFIENLNSSIQGIHTEIVSSPKDASFLVYIVDRKDYSDTVRGMIKMGSSDIVRGRCQVRSKFARFGILRSIAVIVSDEGEHLFERCLIEEILSGLGPLNQDHSLSSSVFNDSSKHITFTRFDRLMLNMLYDKRLKNGDSIGQIQSILPTILKDVKRWIP